MDRLEHGSEPTLASATGPGAIRLPALILAVYLLAMVIAFRQTLLSGFDLGFGDRGDAIIEISILEHWRNVLAGVEAWNQMLYFHGATGALGYNDGYLVSGIFYSFWRLWFDPFLADGLTALTYKTIGFAGTLVLLRGQLRWSWGMALFAALLGAIASNMFIQAVHAQIQTLAIAPWAATLAMAAVRAEGGGDRRRARIAAVALAALLGAWLMTAFYFVWFALYFALALSLCWLWRSGQLRIPALLALVRAHWVTLGVFGVAFVVAAIPFLYVYMPKLAETGGQGYKISYLVLPLDPVNVGRENLLWGWIFSGAHQVASAIWGTAGADRVLTAEHESGFPLLFFLLAVAALHRLIVQKADPLVQALGWGVAISWLLTLRIFDVSPWILVHFLIPGASGLRVVLRYQLFLMLPLLVVIGLAWRGTFERMWRERRWLAVVVALILLVEQLTLFPSASLSRSEHRADFARVPPPPEGCRSFYLVTIRPEELRSGGRWADSVYPHNVDAMLLAKLWRVPTAMGFSTFNPPDWDFADPLAPDFDARVASYAARHGLTGMCRLDMRDETPWRRVS